MFKNKNKTKYVVKYIPFVKMYFKTLFENTKFEPFVVLSS